MDVYVCNEVLWYLLIIAEDEIFILQFTSVIDL